MNIEIKKTFVLRRFFSFLTVVGMEEEERGEGRGGKMLLKKKMLKRESCETYIAL